MNLKELTGGFRAELSPFGALNAIGVFLGVTVITGSHFGDEVYNVLIAAIDGYWHQKFQLLSIAPPTPWIYTVGAFALFWFVCIIGAGVADVRLRGGGKGKH